MSEDLALRLKKVISTQLGVDEAEVSIKSHLKEDLDADPLTISDLLVNIEKEFGIKIDQDETSEFSTVEDILNYISDQVAEL